MYNPDESPFSQICKWVFTKKEWKKKAKQNKTEHFIYTQNFFNYSELFSEKAVFKTTTLIIKYVLYINIYIEISYK